MKRKLPAPALTIQRGAIWWVNLDPTIGAEIRKTRPAIILTADALNLARHTVVVVPLSTAARPRPPIVVATPSAGATSAAVCDQIRCIDKSRLTSSIGALSQADLKSVEQGIRAVLML